MNFREMRCISLFLLRTDRPKPELFTETNIGSVESEQEFMKGCTTTGVFLCELFFLAAAGKEASE
mgnify:CR=1 FL=1